ncbi:MAG TPA: hypothetical protein VK627_02135 [Edaphobacter sp.]|nr:hypothetical protein [Edaphobacter sp.]
MISKSKASLLVASLFAATLTPASAQTMSSSAVRSPQPVFSPANAFTPYTGCSLSEGLSVVETAPLALGVKSRTVKTMKGPYTVNMVEGRRVMFAYPDEEFYANVKVEILPSEGYFESKEALISDFEHTLAGDNSRNYSLKPHLNGFEIQGLDRSRREGGVLGIYLFFDDPNHTVTTIYFLNQEPPKRFKTMQEYAVVRDRFLNEYTSCIRKALHP